MEENPYDRKFKRARWFFDRGDIERARRDAGSLFAHVGDGSFSREDIEEIVYYSEPKKEIKRSNRLLYAGIGTILGLTILGNCIFGKGIDLESIEARRAQNSVIATSEEEPDRLPVYRIARPEQSIEANSVKETPDSVLVYRIARPNFNNSLADLVYSISRTSPTAVAWMPGAADFYKLQLVEVDDLSNHVKFVSPDRTHTYFPVSEQDADLLASEIEKTNMQIYSIQQGGFLSIKERRLTDELADILTGYPVYKPGQNAVFMEESRQNGYVASLLETVKELTFFSPSSRPYMQVTIVSDQPYEIRILSDRYPKIFEELMNLTKR